MKKFIFVFLFFVAIILILPRQIFSQAPTSTPTATPAVATDTDLGPFTLDPPQQPTKEKPDYYITDYLSTVSVQFNDPEIISSNVMYVCLEQDSCIDDDDIRKGFFDAEQDAITQMEYGLAKDQIDEGTVERYLLKGGKLVVCGAGSKDLKTPHEYHAKGGKDSDGGECTPVTDPNNKQDYFVAGKFYKITVYEKVGDTYVLRGISGFLANHGMPKVEITPSKDLIPKQVKKLTVKVSIDQMHGHGKESIKSRNNYQVQIMGPGILPPEYPYFKDPDFLRNGTRCIAFSSPGTQSIEFPTDKVELAKGKYTIVVKEQVNEGDALCQGGFTYIKIECNVNSDPAKAVCTQPVQDPNQQDIKAFYDGLEKLGFVASPSKLPCGKGEMVTDPLKCESLQTAFGLIPLDITGFITKLLSIALSIAGIGALILIIFTGYRLILSRGNKEAIQGARETLTSAIVGLLFIIFSLVILSVIAGDILKIPGFS